MDGPTGKAHRKDAENLEQTNAPEEGACGDKMTRYESPPFLPTSPLSQQILYIVLEQL